MTLPPISYSTSAALVTGATSGIGKAIACAFVKRGIQRLILVARSAEDLLATANEIDGPSVMTIACDLSLQDGPDEIYRKVLERGWTVDYLVNNAGIATEGRFAVDESEGKTATDLVDLNVRAVVRLSELFLPPMLDRKSGGILFIGSTAAYQPVPYSAAYGASKAFVVSFASAIHEENLDSGTRIACVVPGVTRTNLGGEGQGERRGVLENISIKEPQEVAQVALRCLEDNKPGQIVGIANQLLQTASSLVTDKLKSKVIGAAKRN